MSYREDFYRMLEGKTPVSDVLYSRFVMPGEETDYVPGAVGIMAEYANFGLFDEEGKNKWGVPYEIDCYGTGYMPAPGMLILTAATLWRDVVKAPYDYGYDWAAAAERDMANVKWDPETQITSMFGAGAAYFLSLSGFMGFEGTMLAMYDEPDAVHELLDYLCDYDVWVLQNILQHYPEVEVMVMSDATATEMNPFISIPMFREFLLPRYKRVADLLKENGKVISYHNCGRCEDFMDDMVDIGVQVWNCATPRNDLAAFKQRTGNRVICEFLPRFYPDQEEEEVRQQTRGYLDAYATGGAFIWSGFVMYDSDQARLLDAAILDELTTYGKGFYQR
jgi:hypothetical protein